MTGSHTDSSSPVPPDRVVSKPKPALNVVGSYYFGDGLGVNCVLDLKANGEFSFTWNGCLGLYDSNSGPYEWNGDVLVLRPEKPNKREGFSGTHTRFFPVPWGDRLYLISEEQMLGFCGKYQHGWRGGSYDGRNPSFYMRNGVDAARAGELAPLGSPPAVPERFRKYLDDEFCALVTKVLDAKHVTVNKGAADGVYAGTKLSTLNGKWMAVTLVREHDCDCQMWNPKQAAPKLGSQLEALEY